MASPDAPRTTGDDGGALYQALMAHYLHQNELFWDSLRMAMTIQAAVVGGAIAILQVGAPPWFAAFVLGAGFFSTLIMLLVANKRERDRDINRPYLDGLALHLLPAGVQAQVMASRPAGPDSIRLTDDRRIPFRLWLRDALKRTLPIQAGRLRGANALRFMLFVTVVIDLLLLAYVVDGPW